MASSGAQIRADLAGPLRKFWGFEGLRPLQGEVVEAALAGQDALVVLPTGGGKSLCFQLPALLSGRLTVVVSPLISLMKDQVDGLRLIGYPAAALNSSLTAVEERETLQGVRDGTLKLLYLSPERLVAPATRELLARASGGRGVGHIAIDEAHCISHWGHDFRPEYRQLASLRRWFPGASVHAFTATATPRVQDDIASQLGLREAARFIGTFDRPNLTYRVVPKVNPLATVADAVARHPRDAVIVYCISRKDTESMAERLRGKGVEARPYHAGLGDAERREVSEAFAQERLGVVVATVAFGMGIDRANVRCVIHESMPKSIEAYQQETGRAGRDGLPSECVMLYSGADLQRWQRVLRDGAPQQVRHQYALLEEVRRFATGIRCRHAALSGYFGQELPERCDACDICLDGRPEVTGSTRIAQRIVATARDLGGGWGVAHLAAVLAGANLRAIREHSHDGLRGYGCLKEFPREKLQAWIHQLVDQGLLEVRGDPYPVVGASALGLAALRPDAKVELREVPVVARQRRGQKGDGLFEALRAERAAIAAERHVAAYLVLHDSTLRGIADRRPADLGELARIPGIGERKLQDYGERILAVVRRHAEQPTERQAEFFALFDQGMPVAEVAKACGVAPSTAENYLAEWVYHRKPDDVRAWVDDETFERVVEAAARVGFAALKPVKEELEDVSYGQIRVALAHARATGRLDPGPLEAPGSVAALG